MNLTEEEIAERLRLHLPGGERITGVDQLSGGHSNETYVVKGLNQILRLPPRGAVLLESAYGIAKQREILIELGSLSDAPPVPAIVFSDLDGTLLGAPFFLMERLPGVPWNDWQAPDWARDRSEAFLSRISEQAIDALASIHALSPLTTNGPVRSSLEELERWRTSIDGLTQPDILIETFALLERSIPSCDRPAPVHGDPKLPNMLWDDGRLSAVLDWELGFNGDPRWDISYLMIPFKSEDHAAFPGFDLLGLWSAERLAEEWSKRTGRSIDRLNWFEAANMVKIATIYIYGHSLFERGTSEDPRFAAFGNVIEPISEVALRLAKKDAERH